MDHAELDRRAEEWLNGLPAFVQAVTVSGQDFQEGTQIPYEPLSWTVGHSIKGWTVMTVSKTSIRFRRRNALIDERPLPY